MSGFGLLFLAACQPHEGEGPRVLGGFLENPRRVDLPPPASASTAWYPTPAGTVQASCPFGTEGLHTYRVDAGNAAASGSLLISRSDCVDLEIGKSHWEVASFSRVDPLAPSAMNLPARNTPEAGWPDVEGVAEELCDDGAWGTRAWDRQDLDGDGVFDLVLTRDDCTDPSIGVDHWEVHLGAAGGFAEEPVGWSLPAVVPGSPRPWAFTEDESTWGCPDGSYGTMAHSLRDFDGDGRPDLVVSRDDCTDPEIGLGYWAVYPGTDQGFATAPVHHVLPTRSGGRPWWSLEGFAGTACEPEVETTQREVRDLDGDGRLDLVLTRDVCTPWDPTSGWRVHLGEPAGFAATPVDWAVPAASTGAGWPRTSGGESAGECADGSTGPRYWAVRDLDGDSLDDLVLTRDACQSGGPGSNFWLVYKNDGVGFAPEGRRWLLPSGSVGDEPKWPLLETAASAVPCLLGSWGALGYGVLDVDGDAIEDLLLTRDGCADPAAGFDHWRVFFGYR